MRYPSPEETPCKVAVFADAHLGQADGDADDFLFALESVTRAGAKTIVLLGDIFHYFIGDRKFETPLVKRVVEGWRQLRASGVAIRYVEGNRDFFLARSPFADAFSRYGLTDGLSVGGRTYAFVHGDRVNTADLPYRLWRVASKNPLSYAALKVMPGSLARSIVARTEAKLYDTNFKHKTRLPEGALLEEGRLARRAGYDEVLVGHFHVSRTFSCEAGLTRILPAWLEERKHAELTEAGEFVLVEEASAERAVRRGEAH